MSDINVLHNIVSIFIKSKTNKKNPLAWNTVKKSFVLLNEGDSHMSEEILQIASEEICNEF
jgi:hypothetical protein